MNQSFRIRQGLDVVVGGVPKQIIGSAQSVRSVSLLGTDYPGLTLRPHVKVGTVVAAGEPVLVDRHQPIVVPSPADGVVRAMIRGPHRSVEVVTIELSGEGTPGAGISSSGTTVLRDLLLTSGLWTAFRTRPFGVIPRADSTPDAVFVTAIDTNPLAVDPVAALKGMEDAFARGVDAMGALTEGPVFVCQGPGSPLVASLRPNTRTVSFYGPHPAGLPSTHIHHLAPVGHGRVVWHIGWQEVAAIGRLLATGDLSSERIVAIGGPGARDPRLVRTVIGANLEDLTRNEVGDGRYRVVSGSPLHGREGRWLGRFDTQVSILDPAGSDSALPFLSRLLGIRPRTPPPIIPLAELDRAAVAGVPAVPLLRALSIGDTETAAALGCLGLVEEDVALLAYLCASRSDYGPMLRTILNDLALDS